jgi:phage shock protein PspC (stress-responsive transcriptional regulator)
MGTPMQQETDPRFHRGSDRILGGVCSGLAAGFHVDSLWVRIAFVLLVFAQGIGILLYVILWLVMPEPVEGQITRRSGFDSVTADLQRVWAEVRGQFASPVVAPTPTSAESPSGTPTQVGVPVQRSAHNQSLQLGVVLIVIGVIFLANNAGYVNWEVLWPVALISIGLLLLIRNLDRKT